MQFLWKSQLFALLADYEILRLFPSCFHSISTHSTLCYINLHIQMDQLNKMSSPKNNAIHWIRQFFAHAHFQISFIISFARLKCKSKCKMSFKCLNMMNHNQFSYVPNNPQSTALQIMSEYLDYKSRTKNFHSVLICIDISDGCEEFADHIKYIILYVLVWANNVTTFKSNLSTKIAMFHSSALLRLPYTARE